MVVFHGKRLDHASPALSQNSCADGISIFCTAHVLVHLAVDSNTQSPAANLERCKPGTGNYTEDTLAMQSLRLNENSTLGPASAIEPKPELSDRNTCTSDTRTGTADPVPTCKTTDVTSPTHMVSSLEASKQPNGSPVRLHTNTQAARSKDTPPVATADGVNERSGSLACVGIESDGHTVPSESIGTSPSLGRVEGRWQDQDQDQDHVSGGPPDHHISCLASKHARREGLESESK